MNKNKKLLAATCVALGFASFNIQAANIYAQGATSIDLNVEAGLGVFNSAKSYATLGKDQDSSVNWHEAYLRLDLEYNRHTKQGNWLAGIGAVASTTGGDGDAAGFTTGSEGKASLENLFLGWSSADLVPALGTDGLKLSLGRQQFAVGDGFIINSDALSFGKGLEPDVENRGGAYYLAPRRSFDNTFILSIGADEGLKAEVFYLDSGNEAMDELDMTGINLEYNQSWGTLGFLGINTSSDLNPTRDSQKTYSLRYQGNAGVENLFLSAEFASQKQGDSSKDANAGYVEIGWTFATAPLTPSINYRYSKFSETYDPLLYGFSRGFGTWFQGEVASNYAGPFNSNASVHYLGLTSVLAETLSLGAGAFSFKSDNKSDGDLGAKELDIYLEYFPTEYLMVSPLLGFYKPDSTNDIQLGSDSVNTYAQLMLVAFF